MLLYITAREGATTTQGETVASVRDSVCVCVLCYQGPSSVRVYLTRSLVAVTFHGSCNLAELTQTRQEAKHLGCQLEGSRAVVFLRAEGGKGLGRDDSMPP